MFTYRAMLKLRREVTSFRGVSVIDTYLLIPMLRILPLSTSSSSFFQVGYGSAVKATSSSLLSFLKAMGLQDSHYMRVVDTTFSRHTNE